METKANTHDVPDFYSMDFILEIRSDELFNRFRKLNVVNYVKAGLIIRDRKKVLRLFKADPVVGDKIILMGINKSIFDELEKINNAD